MKTGRTSQRHAWSGPRRACRKRDISMIQNKIFSHKDSGSGYYFLLHTMFIIDSVVRYDYPVRRNCGVAIWFDIFRVAVRVSSNKVNN